MARTFRNRIRRGSSYFALLRLRVLLRQEDAQKTGEKMSSPSMVKKPREMYQT